MNENDKEIAYLRKRLDEMQRHKAKARRPPKVKSTRPQGRPPIDSKKLQIAKELAKDFPLADVAFKMDISRSTLYAYGIKRKVLNSEKDSLSNCDSTADFSSG